MQDLTPEQQQAVTKHEEMHKMFQQMGGDLTGGKTALFDDTSAPEVPRETKEVMQAIVANMAIPNPDAIQYTHGGTLGAPEPQPTPDIDSIINTICAQLQLLATVISQSKAQPVEEKSSSNASLQECVSLTLQQADWFKDLIRHELIGAGIEDLAKEAVEDVVESEVESYFENNFDPSYHFDFDDAVHDAVGDRIDDVVSDKIDDALDSYMSNATITITK
jgi:hypothetical protein